MQSESYVDFVSGNSVRYVSMVLVAPTTTLEGLVVDKECRRLDIFEKGPRVSLVNIAFGLRKDVTIIKFSENFEIDA